MGCQARHEIFVAEDHREALMRWILDRSSEESKEENDSSCEKYIFRLPVGD